VIVNNTITSCTSGGVILSSACNATLSSNVVSHTSQGNGLSVYSSAPTIGAGNRFELNSLCGIYLSSSSPAIDSCWVGYNGDCGLKAMYYSNPVVRRTSVVANRYGVAVYMNSNPVLGDSATGRGMLNDIRQNTAYAVYNRTTTKIKSQRNWWGGPPLPSIFVGQVDYSGWLVTAPSGTETGHGEASLVQAIYPNPFSRSVRFSLMIADSDRPVTVSVYDVAGRLMRNLAVTAGAGKATLEWDGRDMFGNPAASGTYFVSIASRGATQTRKVILLH
jgi:hypothetical protein